MTSSEKAPGLTVAVTGPTGDIGCALLRALDDTPEVTRVLGMARSPFEPSEMGLSGKIEYLRGDITDPDSVDELVADAAVVVHLAFLIFGSQDETLHINVEGSRNVFLSALNNNCKRIVRTWDNSNR